MAGTSRVVQVDVARDSAELAADALWQAGPSAVSEVDLGGGRVRLLADVADPDDLTDLPPSCEVAVVEVDADADLDAWRAWAAPVRAGRRIVVHPAWLLRPTAVAAAGDGDGDLVVVLDPGRAFGSGSHPTTRLVLAALEARLAPGDRVLDVGTGSGVLAVAAALLGASAVVAIDVDPAAPGAAVANARANGVAGRVSVSATPLAEVPGTFDLVLANIGARVLQELAPELMARVRPGGLLVVSGLLAGQTGEVVAAFPGFVELERLAEDGWTAPVLRAPG